MSTSTILKWITGACEAFLGIPFLGGIFILSNGWVPLIVMFFLHVITLVLSARDGVNKYGSITGIITSIIGWIPVVGMIMHIITALLLFVDAGLSSKKNKTNVY
ncbi:hypothetical protein H9655_04345 [Cytobacillus sp. Sa5YUA1]|uniref:Uncharacterized protein n=1 Tax=Cytobacillus stercorigallinarum TaxID=2762240 RepID=A0ABR8QL61_9BACI|nr:hypothetical protein [Cytobacillus stercorigallinarum]MBD7936248.1 hypothetical protein [Cytobacillus stercorigallinarum]